MFCTLLKIELKRVLKTLPKLLTGATTLIIIISAVAFCSKHILYNGIDIPPVKVGLVVNDDSYWTKFGVNSFLSNSATESVHFVDTDEVTAREKINDGTFVAAIILPEKVIDSILSGENNPIQIVYPDNCGLEAIIVTELTEAAATILSTGQAGVYSAEDICYEYSAISASKKVTASLNAKYLSYALGRNSLYEKNTLTATEDIPIEKYYLASAIVLFLLFFGINLNNFLAAYNKDASNSLHRRGLSHLRQFLIKVLCCFIILDIIGTTLLLALGLTGIVKSFTFINAVVLLPIILICALIASIFIVFMYTAAGTGTAGILSLSGVIIITGIMSGLFIPQILLPDMVTSVGGLTPAGIMFNIILSFM